MTKSLPPQGTHEPDVLLPGEAELRSLYGELPQTEPGPALDAAVLRAAAEAVSSERDITPAGNLSVARPAAQKTRARPPRWFIGLSSAATLVLAAGLAWHMRSMPQTDSPPTATEAISKKAVDTSAMGTSAADASHASVSSAMLAPVAIPPPPPMPPKQPPPPHAIHAARLQQLKAAAEQARIPPARAPVALQARSAANKVAAPPPRIQPQVIMRAPLPPTAATLERQPPAPPAPPAQSQAASPASSFMPVNDSRKQEIPAAQLAELDEIRQLFADHRDDKAQQRLEAFHRLHPQWQLPVDLQVRLRKP